MTDTTGTTPAPTTPEPIAPTPTPEPPAGDWYYNADAKHVASDLLDERRFFQWSGPAGACPEDNGKQVNAIPVPAKGAYPQEILNVAARLSQGG